MSREDLQSDVVLRWESGSLCLARVTLIALLLIGGTGLVTLLYRVWGYTVDDAFITFRYAENLVQGWGLTFNRTPPRAEGYTSLLWTLVMTIPHALGWPPVLFAKVMGVGITLMTMGLIYLVTWTLGEGYSRSERAIGAMVAVALFLSFPYVAVHAIAGMETALAAFLYATVIGVFLVREGKWRVVWLPFGCFLLGITRPEANLFSVALLIVALALLSGRERQRMAIYTLAFYVFPGMAYFLWRFNYYGMLFPLPFYIKSGTIHIAGVGVTISFLATILPASLVPLFLVLRLRPKWSAAILTPVVLMLGYFVTIDHIMGYGYRYLYPLWPVLSLIGGVGVLAFLVEYRHRSGMRTVLFTIVLLLALSISLGLTRGFSDAAYYVEYAEGLQRAHILLGYTLRSVAWRTESPVLAIGDAGAVPYYSGMTTIDSFGLNDPFIATHFKGDRSTYILSQHPTLIVFISSSLEGFHSPLFYEKALYDSAVAIGYVERAVFAFQPDYFLWALWNPRSPDAEALRDAMTRASKVSLALLGGRR